MLISCGKWVDLMRHDAMRCCSGYYGDYLSISGQKDSRITCNRQTCEKLNNPRTMHRERERRRERELESATCVSAKTGQLQHQQQQQQQLPFGPGRLHSHTSNIFCRCPRSYAKPSCCCCCCCSNVAVVLRDSSRQQNCAIFPMKTKAGKVRQRRPTAADPH